ncbi:MAG: hypothetical protein HQ486_07545 [Acidimicrobiaceae bacterium]|nr:hypothetical protein [Acidimicrobiaceae bacterium]
MTNADHDGANTERALIPVVNATSPAPTTVTEAVAYLYEQGYTDDIKLEGTNIVSGRSNISYALCNVVVDYTFRFEGDSDPSDGAIVLGLRYPDTDMRATLVSAYGHYADPETSEFFARLRKQS